MKCKPDEREMRCCENGRTHAVVIYRLDDCSRKVASRYERTTISRPRHPESNRGHDRTLENGVGVKTKEFLTATYRIIEHEGYPPLKEGLTCTHSVDSMLFCDIIESAMGYARTIVRSMYSTPTSAFSIRWCARECSVAHQAH